MSAPADKASAPVMEFVSPTVHDDKGHEITRTMRPTDKLRVQMDFYYDMVTTVPRGTGVFLYKRMRVEGDHTLADYDMRYGVWIDFFSEMKPDIFVTLTVHDDEGRKVTSTMRRSDEMQVLMDFYCSTVSCTRDKGVFMYGGKELMTFQTPEDLNMKDNDRIDFLSKPETSMVTLTLVDSEARRIVHTIRSNDELQVLMDLYYSTVPIVECDGGSFMYAGRLIETYKTPMELGMEDGHEIHLVGRRAQ